MSSTTRVAPTTARGLRPRPRSSALVLAAAVVGLTLVLAACSSKSGYGTSASSTTTQASNSAAPPYGAGASSSTTAAASGTKTDLAVATTSLGPVVVDASGLTLYTYAKDTGTTATCTGACAKAWPAATVSGTPTSSADITGTVTVNDTGQLVLDGHPLYTYAADGAPGDVNGQGVGGVWSAVKADGQKLG